MSRSPWWAFDGPDEDEQDELTLLEKTALDAVRELAAQADKQPDRVLVVGAALRKISTVAGSHAQTIGLRVATMPRGKAKA